MMDFKTKTTKVGQFRQIDGLYFKSPLVAKWRNRIYKDETN